MRNHTHHRTIRQSEILCDESELLCDESELLCDESEPRPIHKHVFMKLHYHILCIPQII